MARRVAAVVSDLIFATKIVATARSVGVVVATVRSLEGLRGQIAAGDVGLVLVDIGSKAFDPLAAVRAAKETAGLRVVAFGPHVDRAAADAARVAGADQVLPRSSFTVHLPAILQSCI